MATAHFRRVTIFGQLSARHYRLHDDDVIHARMADDERLRAGAAHDDEGWNAKTNNTASAAFR